MPTVLQYGASCLDPYRKDQTNAFDRVQKKAAKFERFGLGNHGAA